MNLKTIQTTIVAIAYIPILILFQLLWFFSIPITFFTFFFIHVESCNGVEYIVRTESFKQWISLFVDNLFGPTKLLIEFLKSII